ncbi:MAG: TetR/AcrR family transcriptional regulator [Pseudomonadota bacterium]
MASTDRERYHHGDLKRALLRETVSILREDGEQGLSFRKLAANLGVSRTAPYNHFENKDGLLAAVAEDGFRLFNDTMQATRARYKNSDGLSLTRAMVKSYVDFARDNQEYYNLMYGRQTWRSGEPAPEVAKVARATLRSDIDLLRGAQSRGLIAEDVDVVQYAQMYWGTLHGISRLIIDGVYTKTASVSKLCDSTAQMLWRQIDPTN